LEIDIDECVKFIEDDVDVVGTDSGGHNGHSFFTNISGMGDEFAVSGFVFNGIEMPGDLVYTGGVSDGEDCSGNFFGPQIEVIDGAAAVKY